MTSAFVEGISARLSLAKDSSAERVFSRSWNSSSVGRSPHKDPFAAIERSDPDAPNGVLRRKGQNDDWTNFENE